jgi:hypothetical protein
MSERVRLGNDAAAGVAVAAGVCVNRGVDDGTVRDSAAAAVAVRARVGLDGRISARLLVSGDELREDGSEGVHCG